MPMYPDRFGRKTTRPLAATTRVLTLIQGPRGTGKTSTSLTVLLAYVAVALFCAAVYETDPLETTLALFGSFASHEKKRGVSDALSGGAVPATAPAHAAGALGSRRALGALLAREAAGGIAARRVAAGFATGGGAPWASS